MALRRSSYRAWPSSAAPRAGTKQQAAIAEDLGRPDITVVDRPGATRPPRAMPRRPVGRRGRRESEWYARLLLLSNRLTRYAYAGQQAVKRESERLLLAEARMADVVVAAHGIETSYVRIRPVTHAFALSPVGKAVGDKDVKGIDAVMVAARGRRL